MPDTLEEVILKNRGITFHFIKTDKFKTISLFLKLKAPLTKADATKRALLPYVLQSGTNTYSNSSALRKFLDDLYGATLFVDLQKKGEYHIISISMDVANEKFLNDRTPLLEKAIQLLSDVIFNPKTTQDGFDKEIVEKEKRTLKQRIRVVYDDKMRYANLRLVEEMCKDEPYSIHVNGILEDVDQINEKNLYEYYKSVLKEDQIDLYVVGDVDINQLQLICKQYFQFEDRTPKEIDKNLYRQSEKENVVIERQDVAQGKLNIGFRTNITYGDSDYFALQVYNGLFGGFPHSKLFINVREKASLAYYAASRIESHKGLMMVMTGIEPKNYDQALSIIKEQFQAMNNGEFSENELEQTKAVIQNQMLETLDTARGMTEVLYHNVLSNSKVPEEVWMEKIKQVTKEDVIQVGKKIVLDTIYFLTGQEG